MKNVIKWICALMLLSPSLLHADAFFKKHESGWFWYEKPVKSDKNKPKAPIAPTVINPTTEMETYRKKIEDSLNLAILQPTEENLRNYAKNYFEVIERGQRFSDAYQLMLLKNPQFDYNSKFPVNALAQNIYDTKQKDLLEDQVKAFAKTHGFFFFFSSHCEYCHLFAPIIKTFADKYGIAVLAISLDGGTIPLFPKTVVDNGISTLFKVSQVPALFAVEPHTRTVVPLAHHPISLLELEQNVQKIIKATKQQGGFNENIR